MATIRDYNVTVSNITASITVNDGSKTSYAALPTLAEIRRVTGQPVEVINLNQCFMNCGALTTAPAIPNGVIDMNACFFGCESLTTAPTIPNSVTNMDNCFAYCTALAIAPAIPTSVTNMINCFRNCKSLTTAPTIPSSVTRMSDCFAYCTALTGKITIDANPSGYVNCMAYTQKEIVLTGSSTLLQNIADTATNSNVYVWSLSINLSAERQKDDLSKAYVSVIINRFRNNNESVSLTFTINSAESTPVQVTMDTVTKTYTGVLSITPSSTVKLSVIAEDSYGKSAPKSITIPIPFYTIDFQAGGKEIAVGAPANDDTSNRPYGLFKCGMDLVVTSLVGEIKMWAGDAIPDGWLLCDGSEVSKTEYPCLYASIGDLWGVPNSSSNFKLPNLNGKVPVGYDSSDTDFATVGHTDGEKTHPLSVTELPSHRHPPFNVGDRLLDYNYSTTGAGVSERRVALASSGNYIAPVVNSSKTDWAGHDYTGYTGGGAAHNNLQPYAVVKYIICAF